MMISNPSSAEDLLLDALQTVLQILVHIRRHIALRHSGLLHQNQRLALICTLTARTQLTDQTASHPMNNGTRKATCAGVARCRRIDRNRAAMIPALRVLLASLSS